jgi:hypothetical protein
LVVALLVLAFSLWRGFASIDRQTISYNESGRIDYQVCLKDNQYFAKPCLDQNRQYIASLIDNVSPDFNYTFEASENMTYDYSYDISTDLLASEKDDSEKILFHDHQTILNSSSHRVVDSLSFSIKEKINLDYHKYNSLITAFRKDYSLIIDARLVVTLKINLIGTSTSLPNPIRSSQDLAITIPLSERTINVKIDSKNINHSEQLTKYTRLSAASLIFFCLAFFDFAALVVVAGLSLKTSLQQSRAKTNYQKALTKIIKSYNQLIVETTHIPNFPRSKTIKVSSFEELLDAHDTIQKPILHLKVSPSRSLFVIEDGDLVYTFLLCTNSKKGV